MPDSMFGDLIVPPEDLDDTVLQRELRISDERLRLMETWAADPWAFLTGKDTDGTPIVWTMDPGNKERIRPFPTAKEKPHVPIMVELLLSEKRLFLNKARQMMASTTVLLVDMWQCLFHEAHRSMLSKHKEQEAVDLLRDKCRFTWSRMPEWLRKARPQSKKPANRIDYPLTNSAQQAVPENAAVADARGPTLSRIVVDEAAYQQATPEIVAAAEPMAAQIVILTTPNIGNLGAAFCRSLLMAR